MNNNFIKNRNHILSGFTNLDLIKGEPKKTGPGFDTYADTAANRAKGVVGQKYPWLAKEEAKSSASPSAPQEEENSKYAPKADIEDLISKQINPDDIIKYSGKPASEVFSAILKSGKDITSFTNKYEMSEEDQNSFDQLLPEVSVHDRWHSYEIFADMVIEGRRKSMVAYGMGGVGKTFNILKAFKRKGLKNYNDIIAAQTEAAGEEGQSEEGTESQVDPLYTTPYFKKYGGTMSANNMYKALYEHRHENATLLFDDIDSVLLNKEIVEMLKNVLDTSGDGSVTYGKEVDMQTSQGEDIPKEFQFKGKAIFISNLKKDNLPQPIKSRSLTIDLTMTKEETIDKLESIKDGMEFQDSGGKPLKISQESINDALVFVKKYIKSIKIEDLNGRTFGAVALIREQFKDGQSSNDSKYMNRNWEATAATIFK